MEIRLAKWKVNSTQSTLHTNLEIKNPILPTHKIKREAPAPSIDDMSSHWLHGNSFPKISCHYFWPGLISLPKNTLTVYCSYLSIEKEA